MTLHKKHTHGHVFAGEEARDMLAMHKRDSHGDRIRMHVPAGYPLEYNKDAVVATATAEAVSVVYVTLAQTFTGPAIYSTLSDSASATTPAAAVNVAQTSAVAEPSSTAAFFVSPASSSVAEFSAAAASSSAALASSTAIYVGPASTNTGGPVVGVPMQTTRAAAASATAAQVNADSSSNTSSSNAGMSGGAKAGLAFGLILGIAMIAGLVFFCWRRRRNPDGHEELLDEKHTSFVDAKAKSVESRSRNSFLNSTRSTSTAPRLSLRPVTQFLPNLSADASMARRPVNANPFEDSTAMSEKPRANSPPHNPFEEARSGPNSAKQTPRTSWSGSEASTVAAAAAPGGSPAARGPNNVHRVQLDFKPSMDDELELRSGQLVRMLHEYDDGWALCIRMDRSQQGVAPRTCLSKMPVKPRPQGPPGPNSRPGTAQSDRRPSNGQRPQGPMQPRPLTPTQAARPNEQTSPNGSQLPRKPVPGQAL